MYCMKCGRKMETSGSFCSSCLADMQKYPVDSNIAIQLPPQKEKNPTKKPISRRRITPEEQILRLKKRIKVLSVSLVIVSILFLSLLYPAANYFIKKYHLRPGQNYTTFNTTESSETVPTTEPTGDFLSDYAP